MSGLQNLLVSILPSGWRESLETGSRGWRTRCSGCGYESNVWDMGGIRWKAVGNALWRMRCPGCGRLTFHLVSRIGALAAGSWLAEIKTESRSWHTRCPKCGHESNVWDMGGIRWKAAGSSRRLMRCTSCARLGMHRVYRP